MDPSPVEEVTASGVSGEASPVTKSVMWWRHPRKAPDIGALAELLREALVLLRETEADQQLRKLQNRDRSFEVRLSITQRKSSRFRIWLTNVALAGAVLLFLAFGLACLVLFITGIAHDAPASELLPTGLAVLASVGSALNLLARKPWNRTKR